MITDTSDPLGKTVLKQRGKVDYHKVYSTIREWFNENDYDTTEKENTQSVKAHGDECKSKLIGNKEVNSYIEFEIKVEIFAPEVKKDSGNLRVTIEPSLNIDYRGYFNKNSFTKFLKYIYNNYIIYKKIKKYYETKVYLEYLSLCTAIKEVMNQYD